MYQDMRRNGIRQKMIEMMENFKYIDVSQTPSYRTMVSLQDVAVKHGVPSKTAALMVAAMELSVNDNFVNDEELFSIVVDAYGSLLGRMYAQVCRDFPDPEVSAGMMTNMAKTMSLTYSD